MKLIRSSLIPPRWNVSNKINEHELKAAAQTILLAMLLPSLFVVKIMKN